MPNTIKITSSISWTDGKDTLKTSFANTITQVGTAVIEAIQNIGTNIEAIQLGDVSAGGYVTFVNRDSTNSVEISSDNAGLNVVADLGPGEGVTLPTSVAAFWGKATGGAINLLVMAFDA